MQFHLPYYNRESGAALDDGFSVVRIICIGRNYADHAIEMGHDPKAEPPFFFYKPITALNTSGGLTLPHYSNNVHYELELVLALTSGGKNLNAQQAQACIGGFAIGLDMTCRDTQQQAKQAGRPWELAKGFDQSAPCSPIARGSYTDLAAIGPMTLTRNGEQVQHGNWRDMTWQPLELLQYLSQLTELQPGDLLYTGTPAGVGQVQAGDVLEANVEGLHHGLTLTINA